MAFLIHVDYGGRPLFRSPGRSHIRRVVHGEIASDIHTTIRGHVRFEVSSGNQNAADHGRGRIIVRGVIATGTAIDLIILITRMSLTAANRDVRHVIEIPHDMRRGMRICIAHRIRHHARWPGIAHQVAVRDFRAIPPEPPAVMKVDIRTTVALHIDDHRSGVRNVLERERQSPCIVRIPLVQQTCVNGEDLHRGIVRSHESKHIFLLLFRILCRILRKVEIVLFLTTVVLVAVLVIPVITVTGVIGIAIV